MLFINPDDFVDSTRQAATKALVRLALRRGARGLLTREELAALHVSLRRCVVFGDLGVTRRVVYLRADDAGVTVREIIHGKVTTAYNIGFDSTIRDLNLEFAVIDGIVMDIERITAEVSIRKMSAII